MNLEQLKKVMPRVPDEWAQALLAAMPKWEISTPLREAAFIAQLAHESVEMTHVEENLNYSATALAATFPRVFPTVDDAAPYAHQPERIANLVYANRLGNGSLQSGDGWHYRGRGPIQLTGRENYRMCGLAIQQPLEEFPELVLRPSIGCEVACWYWRSHGLNELADAHEFAKITKAINGGMIGHAERVAYYIRAKSVFEHANA